MKYIAFLSALLSGLALIAASIAEGRKFERQTSTSDYEL